MASGMPTTPIGADDDFLLDAADLAIDQMPDDSIDPQISINPAPSQSSTETSTQVSTLKPSMPFQELLQLAKEFEKAPNSQKKKHFWSSGELEKMKPWQHLLAMRPGTTAPADLKTGTWVWCGACQKEIKTCPFLAYDFLRHCTKDRFKLVHGKAQLQQPSLVSMFGKQFGSSSSKSTSAGTSLDEPLVKKPRTSLITPTVENRGNNACTGVDLTPLLTCLAVSTSLGPMEDNDLLEQAALTFLRFSSRKDEVRVEAVDVGDGKQQLRLKSKLCSGLICNGMCRGCIGVKNLVTKAYYNKDNKKKRQGPMVKALHAHYVLESSQNNSALIEVLEDIKRDGPKTTFDKEAWAKLNRAALARLGFLELMTRAGPVAQEVMRIASTTAKTQEDSFLLHAVEFLTDDKFRNERAQVPMALFYSLVKKAFDAKTFSTGMDDTMRSRLLDGMVNIHLISPTSSRTALCMRVM